MRLGPLKRNSSIDHDQALLSHKIQHVRYSIRSVVGPSPLWVLRRRDEGGGPKCGRCVNHRVRGDWFQMGTGQGLQPQAGQDWC